MGVEKARVCRFQALNNFIHNPIHSEHHPYDPTTLPKLAIFLTTAQAKGSASFRLHLERHHCMALLGVRVRFEWEYLVWPQRYRKRNQRLASGPLHGRSACTRRGRGRRERHRCGATHHRDYLRETRRRALFCHRIVRHAASRCTSTSDDAFAVLSRPRQLMHIPPYGFTPT